VVVKTAGYNGFYNGYFNNYSDENPDLMGLPNGILQTCSDKAIVRPGKPEDYVTMSATVYYTEHTWNHPRVEEFMYWMRQCFIYDDMIQYFLKLIASCLRSGNTEKIFPILSGGANNSKSMVKKLIEQIFGAYAHTFPTTLFTQKRTGSSNATPEMALSRGAKIAFAKEPDAGSKMNDGVVKEISGGDKMFVRKLHENGGMMLPSFTTFFICNQPAYFANADKAIIERLIMVGFDSTWSYDAPESEEEQFAQRLFPRLKNFENCITRMAPAVFWVLVQMYRDYCKYGLVQPDRVLKATKDYWNDNDIYACFARECLQKAYIPGTETDENPNGRVDSNAKVSLTEVYRIFKDWHRDAYPNDKAPSRNEMRYILEQR
jgi:phage/plasmid-associated DNA primase